MTSTGCDLTQEDLLGKTLKQLLSEQIAVTSLRGRKRKLSLFKYDLEKCGKCQQPISRHGCNKLIQEVTDGHALMEVEYKNEAGDICLRGHHLCGCGVQAMHHVNTIYKPTKASNEYKQK
jgi:hypothetical protein